MNNDSPKLPVATMADFTKSDPMLQSEDKAGWIRFVKVPNDDSVMSLFLGSGKSGVIKWTYSTTVSKSSARSVWKNYTESGWQSVLC